MNTNLSNNVLAANSFPKTPLILRVAKSHVSETGFYGSITKFYIHQHGFGFISNQQINSPFNDPSASSLSFNVVIEDGSLKSMTILGDEHPGYSENDTEINIKIPSPNFQPPQAIAIETDSQSWSYGMYLNDTPVRDRSGYFNFSKLDIDMRIGHIKNGNNDSFEGISISNLLYGSDSSIMSSEYRLPSITNPINYPLYGPRNNGEMDYYYTHTIKNPNVTSAVVSINIEQLHYIYEGDESNMYVNLSPVLTVAAMFYLVNQAAQNAIEAKTSTILKGSAIVKTGVKVKVVPCTGAGGGSGDGGGPVTVYNPAPAAKIGLLGAATQGIIAGVMTVLASSFSRLTLNCSTVPFLCFKVGTLIKNSGEIWPAKVHVEIMYGIEGEELTRETVVFRGCATNHYIKDIPIENLPPADSNNSNNLKNRIIKVYRSTREADPVRQGIVEARYKIKTSLHSVTEYVEHYLSFPNTAIVGTRINAKDHPSIPKREYLIKGRIIKVPSNYDPINGIGYSNSWNGKFIDQWSSNPAWVIYDLLTNERYGVGKYGLLESQVDKWSFYQFAEYCDERIDTVIDGITDSGTPYQERRHMCNLYVDTEYEAYDYIQKLLSIYNASLNFSGHQIYITYDKSVASDEIVMLFTNSNIQEDGFNYSSTPSTSRITAVTIDYRDERDNYMKKSEYVEDHTYIAEHGYSHIRIPGIGITRKGEAHRVAWNKILTQQLEREIIQFKAGLQASYLKIGDVIEVIDNNKISKHYGGIILEIVSNRIIKLDIPSSIISNADSLKISNPNTSYSTWSSTNSYFIDDIVYSSINFLAYVNTTNSSSSSDPSTDLNNWSLINSVKEPQYTEYDISSRSGFEVTLSTDLDSNIKEGFTWLAIDSSLEEVPAPKPYRIKSIKETSSMIFEITAIEYIQDKYDFINQASSNSSIAIISDRSGPAGPDGNVIVV